MAVLEVRELRTEFSTDEGRFPAVDGVSFSVEAGKTLAIVGESGCGKSVTALSIMGLVPDPPGRIAGGSIRFEGRELVGAPKRDLLDLRGNGMAMIFQEPMTSLNPAFTIGEQIMEGLLRHRQLSRASARERAIEVLRQVRIPAPEQRFDEYPHKLSGGMRQRAMIAMALACKPRLLIADEPTTALDVTIQAQILALMRTLQAETGTAVILITHDLGVVAETAQRVIVMYAGKKVEEAEVEDLFGAPLHPYTHGLMASIPQLGIMAGEAEASSNGRLKEIPGMVPPPFTDPDECAFRPRCPGAKDDCATARPLLAARGPDHLAACFHPAALTRPAGGAR